MLSSPISGTHDTKNLYNTHSINIMQTSESNTMSNAVSLEFSSEYLAECNSATSPAKPIFPTRHCNMDGVVANCGKVMTTSRSLPIPIPKTKFRKVQMHPSSGERLSHQFSASFPPKTPRRNCMEKE